MVMDERDLHEYFEELITKGKEMERLQAQLYAKAEEARKLKYKLSDVILGGKGGHT